MSEMTELIQAFGKVQGKLEALESAQMTHSDSVRTDVRTLHARIETMTTELKQGQEKLFKEGCARARDHIDHEGRLRDVENWKIGHDSEAKTLAHDAGSKAGGTWGALTAAAMAILGWIIQERFKGQP